MKQIHKDYLSITKPRIGVMVLVVTTTGFFLGAGTLRPYPLLFFCLLGTLLASSGACVLNNFLERENDKRMNRTKNRALATGRISAAAALGYGTSLVLIGVGLLVWQVNLLTGFLALLTTFLYVVVYTPLKRVTVLNTAIGAIPGALPPIGGWAASTGSLDLGAWILFCILFLWQFPHFYSIAWLYRDDYRRGELKMLPAIDLSGVQTNSQILFHSLLLIPISVLPFYIGMAGSVYLWGSLFLGIFMLLAGLKFIFNSTPKTARGLLRASLLYLPAMLLVSWIDLQLIL